jgi:hypothetical protein
MTAQNTLENMVRRDIISPSGLRWAKRALDPFADLEDSLEGLPDSDTSRVLIESFTESATVSAPPGTVGNWDAHVFSLPLGLPTGMVLGVDYTAAALRRAASMVASTPYEYTWRSKAHAYLGMSSFGPAGFSYLAGLCNIDTFSTSGGLLAPTVSPTTYAGPATHAVLGNPPIVNGKRRLIAAAWEIHDTTAPLYKQGTSTSYRVPQAFTAECAVGEQYNSANAGQTFYGNPNINSPPTVGGSSNGDFQTSEFQVADLPPATIARAMTYPGSRQWEAKDGSYTVLAQDVVRNRLAFNLTDYVAFTDGDYNPAALAVDDPNSPAYSTAIFTPSRFCQGIASTFPAGGFVVNGSSIEPPNTLPVPFHTSGTMLTGLNVNSTFTVTLRTYWEVAPDLGDPSGAVLVPLTRPSPELDMIAQELYQRAVAILPVAVPVAMNAEGDWGDWILKALEAAAGPVGAMLGFGAVGSAAGAGIGVLRAKRNSRDKLQDDANRSLVGRKTDSVFKPDIAPKRDAGKKFDLNNLSKAERLEYNNLVNMSKRAPLSPGLKAELEKLRRKAAK